MKASNATDAELMTLAAEQVMGWKRGSDFLQTGGSFFKSLGSLPSSPTTPEWLEWRPLTRDHDAFALVAAVCEKRKMWFKLHSPFRPGMEWWAGFCPEGAAGWNGEMDFAASAPDHCRAIALACLEAFQVWERGAQ